MNRFFFFILRLLVLNFIFQYQLHAQPPHHDSAGVSFKKHILDSGFVAEGVAVGDVNKDGKKDCLAQILSV